MRLNVKMAAMVVAVALLLVASVATAVGATAAAKHDVALQVGGENGSGFTGAYGDEITLQPAVMDKIELPGERFTFQVYVEDTTTTTAGVREWKWLPFQDFEDIALEDTNTVQPFTYRLGMDDMVILTDGSSVLPKFPYQIRVEYKTFDSSGTVGSTSPKSFSETETVTLLKNSFAKVAFSPSGAIRRAGTKFKFQVAPNSGIGTIRVLVSKPGMKTKTYNLKTDEDGAAAATLKLGTAKGAYKVSARFLGNIFGAASASSSRFVVANR